MYAPFISKTNHSFSPNASNRNTNFVFICTAYVLRPKQCIKKDLRQPTALITFIHRGITRAQWHSNEIGSSLKIENTSSMACQGRGFSGALTRTHTLSPDRGMIFFFLKNKILWPCILNLPYAFPVNQQLFLLITPRTYCGILFVFRSGHVTPWAPGNTG